MTSPRDSGDDGWDSGKVQSMAGGAQLQAEDQVRWAASSWYCAERVVRSTSNGVELVCVYTNRPKQRSNRPDVAFAPTAAVEIAGRPIRVTVSGAGLEEADETVLSVKTLDTVRAVIVELHSYDTPSIWSYEAQADSHEWLETETGRDRP